jgi:predicted RNA-binding Zn-ribbon protein involved in translation (DUF1610 family)
VKSISARPTLEIPAAEREPARFAPLFVLAPARSFSSVVVTMIGQHPQLAGMPELKLFGHRTIADLESSLPAYWRERGFTHRSPGLVRALAEFEFGGQTPKRIAAAREWLRAREHWSGADVLDVLMARVAPRRVVEKSPENVSSTAALKRLRAAYPNARYLHLTRHPLTTQVSAARHLRQTVPEHPQAGEPMAGIAAWVEVHQRILRFTAALSKPRALRVRAEDVLNAPEKWLPEIARWLEIRDDDEAIEAMRHPESSPFARFGPRGSGVIGGHDHGFLRDPVPRRAALPASFEPPEGWIGEPQLWRRAASLARRFGYADATARKRRRPGVSQPALRDELLRRAAIDRAAREAYAGDPAEMTRLMAIDADNTGWLTGIIDQSGWPGRSQVGDEAARAAWLLAQHADCRPAAQRRFWQCLQSAVARDEASPADLARLTDRVRLASGQKQIYGTQLTARAGRYVATRLCKPSSVDARRAAVGLEPLAAQIESMPLRRAPLADCPGCGKRIEITPPAPGHTTRFHCPACGATGTVHRGRPREAPGVSGDDIAT